jgi:hypothetical protein
VGLGITNHAEGQRRRHHGRSAIDGQFFDFLGGNGLAQGGVIGVEERRVGGHFHRRGHVADVESHVDDRMIIRPHVHSLAKGGFEARHLHGDVVVARQEKRSHISAGGIGNRGYPRTRVRFRDGQLGPRDGGAGGISNNAADGAAKFLSE